MTDNTRMTKIITSFAEAMQEMERENYENAIKGLEKGTITFGVDENGDTVVKFNSEDELLVEFTNYKFLRDIDKTLLWYCYNKENIPVSEIEKLTIEQQALIIAKCIEECDCMCSYEECCGLVRSCV